MSEFTKGNWVIGHMHGDLTIESNHDENGFHDLICGSVEPLANAHLIAAAPEMYNLLEDLRQYVGEGNRNEIEQLLAKAR